MKGEGGERTVEGPGGGLYVCCKLWVVGGWAEIDGGKEDC